MAPSAQDFRSRPFLLDHIRWMIDYHVPSGLDPRGGFFQDRALDGSIADPDRRGLVSSARMVVLLSMAGRALDRVDLREAAAHGVAFLRAAHRTQAGGYAWEVAWEGTRFAPTLASNQAYGLAHVALAFSHAHAAGVAGCDRDLAALFDLMEARMRDGAVPLYVEEYSADFLPLSAYRGQNSNMHSCEAWLAAFEATGERRYLARAVATADALCVDSAAGTHGFVYEHFRPDWTPDFDYNRGDFSDIFRPWGFQPGHQTEWAKFLLRLAGHADRPDLAVRARAMFDAAVGLAWDDVHGGLYYGLAPDLAVANTDKYFWVQIESAVAAMGLARHFGETAYAQRHDALWGLCWTHFVDHVHGSWNTRLTRDLALAATDKGFAGKDYHVVGACFDLLAMGAV